MDCDYLLVDVNDSGIFSNKALDSPNLSSGYCSSEDGRSIDSSHKHVFNLRTGHMTRSSSPCDEAMLSPRPESPSYDAMFNPFEHETLEYVQRGTESGWQQVSRCDNSQKHRHDARQSIMSQFSRHLTSELGEAASTDIGLNTSSVSQPSIIVTSCSANGATVVSRNQCTGSTLPSGVMRPLARTRGGATLASCSVLLRHSASVPNKISSVTSPGTLHCEPNNLYTKARSSTRGFSAEGSVTMCDALRDHMYAMKPCSFSRSQTSVWAKRTPVPLPQKPVTQTVPQKGKMSILEAFLRSTTHRFDANRGSTEIAAEEFAKLQVSAGDVAMKVDESESAPESSGSLSNSLLKQLLTGEISTAEIENSHSGEDQLEMGMSDFSVDSVLTDGFGLDVNLQLDDPLSNGIGLLGADNSTHELTVLTAEDADMILSCDIDQTIQEQLRHEGLLWKHYTSNGLL